MAGRLLSLSAIGAEPALAVIRISRTLVTRIVQRLAGAAAVFVAASTLAFMVCEMMPGDAYSDLIVDPGVSPFSIAALRHEASLDRPLLGRYLAWARCAATGDLGRSRVSQQPVAALVSTRASRTLLLGITALVTSWGLAIPIGVLAAARDGRSDSRLLTAALTVLLGVPDLVIATAFVLAASASGISGPRNRFAVAAVALTVNAVPYLARHVYASVRAILAAPYILAAVARGVPRRRILLRSALRPAAIPLVPLFGLSVAALVSTSIVVEAIVGWPGIGPMLLDGVLARDTPVVLGCVLVATLLLVSGNLLADGLLMAIDPRLEVD